MYQGPGGSSSRPHFFLFLSRFRNLLFLSLSLALSSLPPHTTTRTTSPNLVYLPTVDSHSFRSNLLTLFFPFSYSYLSLLARFSLFSSLSYLDARRARQVCLILSIELCNSTYTVDLKDFEREETGKGKRKGGEQAIFGRRDPNPVRREERPPANESLVSGAGGMTCGIM